MDVAPFSAHDVNTPRAAVEGEKKLADGSWLLWGLSRKEMGPMSFTNRPEWDVTHNRMQFLRIWDLRIDDVISPTLEHTSNVRIVTAADKRKGAREISSAFPDTDALVTQEKNIVLMTTHADCLPVWMVAPHSGWVGMAHAGWRGVAAGVLSNMVEAVPAEDRQDLTLAIGPGISVAHYEVGEEVANVFRANEVMAPAIETINGSLHLNLMEAARLQGEAAGAIVDTSMFACTFEKDYLSSYRRDGDQFTPMAAFITMGSA